MRHYRALAKHFVFATAAALTLALPGARGGAQIVFDGLDFTTDRGNILFDTLTNRNGYPSRQGFNNVGPAGAPNPQIDAHRAQLRFTFPYTLDLQGITAFTIPATYPATTTSNPTLGGSPGALTTTLIVDNPFGLNNGPYGNYDKSNVSTPSGLPPPAIFDSSSQPLTFPFATNTYAFAPATAPYFNPALNARSLWLPTTNAWTIPAPALRTTAVQGFSFNFVSSDPTIANDPYAANPPIEAQNDYGYVFATHNDFTVNRGTTSSPLTADEAQQFPGVTPNIYSAVHTVLAKDYDNTVANGANAHAIAQWTIGVQQNHNADIHDPYDTVLSGIAGYNAANTVPQPVPYDTEYNTLPAPNQYSTKPPYLPNSLTAPTAAARPLDLINKPNAAIAPGNRSVKFVVALYSPGSGTSVLDANGNPIPHPTAQRAFVRVSWKNTIVNGGVNPGVKNAAGNYIAGAGGVNDPSNSRIFDVDLSQPGWINLGAPNAAPASFPNGGGSDQIVVTLFSLTPDSLTDPNLYGYPPLVTADACRFTQQDTPGLLDKTILNNPDLTVQFPNTPLGPLHNGGPANNPNNQFNRDTEYVSLTGRFLGPPVGVRTIAQGTALDKLPHQQPGALAANDYVGSTNPDGTRNADGSILWYCVREEIINNQVRVATDPTLPVTTANPLIIDPAATATAPVFYCLTNENNVISRGLTTDQDVLEPTKLRVRWRYVGYPDNGSATSFTSPVIANARGRDGRYHTIVYFCSSSTTSQNGNAGRIYALDALGDPRTIYDNTTNPPTPLRTTQTTAYWTYPSLRPLDAASTKPGIPNEYYDPNFTGSQSLVGIYPVNGTPPAGTPPNSPRTPSSGYWWAPDQTLYTGGAGEYYDGDLVAGTTQDANGNPVNGTIVKTDTHITMGGITGAPVVMEDPSNPGGAMILIVPSLDGHIYAFDAAGRGDFDDTKPLPVPPVDPANPNLPAATIGALNVSYAIPGTTQRLWTWPHFGADAFHRKTTLANVTQPNTYPSEATNGAMPYTPAFDPTYAPGNIAALAPLLVSAGSPPVDGLPGTGHVYGILPLHDGGFNVGSNNTLNWYVSVNSGLATGTTDRRYFAFPREGTRVSDAGDPALQDIPGLPTIFTPTNAGAGSAVRYAYFGSGGRVYSVQLPTQLPPGGVLPVQRLNWVYPYTPTNYIPYNDPNDSATLALAQGVAARGLAVIPGTFAGITNSKNTLSDTCYALLTDGTMLALEADPDGDGTRPAGGAGATQTNLLSRGQSLTGQFTESAPTLVALTVDPNFGGAIPVATQPPTTSVPALMFGDDSGNVFAIQATPKTYSDGTVLLPTIFDSSDSFGGQYVTPPVLVSSTLRLTTDVGGSDPRAFVPLAAQPNTGGYIALGDTNGQLNVFGVGLFLDGFGGSEGSDKFTGAGAGDVSIDMRTLDFYTNYTTAKNGHKAREYDGAAPGRGQALGSGYTPAHHEAATRTGGADYANTIKPADGNVTTSVSNTGLAVDEGGNIYLIASGVYHAQTPDTTQQSFGGVPTITVAFSVSQNNTTLPATKATAQAVTPLNQTNSPGKGVQGNQVWPDDRAIALADKEQLSIYGVDLNAPPSGQPDPTGLGALAPQKLTGTAQNVFPWVAKVHIPITPNAQGTGTSYTPLSSGYTVSATVTITQTVNTKGSRSVRATKEAFGRAGQRDDQGMSNSPYQPDPNDPTINGASRGFYITNPLALTVRGVPNNNFMQDLTGTPRELNGGTHSNIIGWAGPVDNPNFNSSIAVNDIRELLGTGSSVSVAAVGGNAIGYNKPLFAPFDLTPDNATANYTADNNGTRTAAIYVMDRSDLPRVTGGRPSQVRVRISPLTWHGTVRSVLNPLPFDQLPDDEKPTVDYPAIDPRATSLKINGADATRGAVSLKIPTPAQIIPGSGGEVDPSTRVPQPTQVDMSVNVPRFQPANVNRGLTQSTFRGATVYTGGMFTDQGGFARGYDVGVANAIGATPRGAQITEPIIGPLDTQTGAPVGVNKGSLIGSSPAGGYIANVSVTLVPTGGSSTGSPAGVPVLQRGARGALGLGALNGAQVSINRSYQTGICIAPTFRMRVAEDTLDMGSVPAGTGYSDLGTNGFRYPFAPSATNPYEILSNNNNPNGQINYSPWDTDGQFSLQPGATGLPTLGSGTTIPNFGRFFRPFTLVNESNVNLTNVRVSKLIGPHTLDKSANPDMTKLITNQSLSFNPPATLARSLRLSSDAVNSLLSPPLLATPFGQGAPSLGNIGVVTSFDHPSYASGVISELSMYPIINPAVTDSVLPSGGQPGVPLPGSPVQQAIDLYNMGLIEIGQPQNQWKVNVQPYPTIHKPRLNDGTGTLATIPDQPHDFQTSTLNNNPTQNNQPSYYQQLSNAGLFGRPAMAVAVPMGTPVGTYSTPLYPFEDGLPVQWREWLMASDPQRASNPSGEPQVAYLGMNDGILNTNTLGQPTEPYASPGTNLKVAVRETRMTEGVTTGVMPQIDLPGINNNTGDYNPLGFNLQPAALMVPYNQNGTNFYNRVMLFWTTNRQQAAPGSGQNNGKYVDGATGLPTPVSPLNIGYTSLTLPYVRQSDIVIRPDAAFAGPANVAGKDSSGNILPGWWGINGTASYGLLPGFDNSGLPNNYASMFGGVNGNAATVAYASPATTLGVDYNVATGTVNYQSTEAYMTMQGQMDVAGTATVGLARQRTLSRTFITALNGAGQLGLPQNVTSFDNDPNIPKLSPRPTLIRLHNVPTSAGTQDMKFLYVFYHSGSQGRTSLYYNVNTLVGDINGQFSATGFQPLGDQKLPTPAALTWQSDPYPVYRRVYNPLTNQLVDAVEVMYTGVMRNRQTVEILLSRFRIVEQPEKATADTPALQVGQLVPIPFPTVHQETLTRITGTNTYAGRDAGWFVPSAAQFSDASVQANNTVNQVDPTANRFMRLYIQPGGAGAPYLINGLNNNNAATRGRIDAASGLVYFNAVATDAGGAVVKDANNRPAFSGGQVVVDARSGTLSFPNIAPGKRDAVLASYTPYVMRLNTSRDESNAERDMAAIGSTGTGNIDFQQLHPEVSLLTSHPGTVSSGQNYAPTYIMDRAPNPRALLQSPQVLFFPNGNPDVTFDQYGQPVVGTYYPPIDRMWTLYRKTDPSTNGSALYMKSLRLMARLPYPVALSSVNGGTNTSPLATQVISSLTVKRLDPATGNFVNLNKAYEVDWTRGRVYFQEEDEGAIVQISYTYFNPVKKNNPGIVGNSGVLTYRVAWSDEKDADGSAYDKNGYWIGYVTTPEVAMPISTSVNEGQVAAFKDPLIDKLWVFWSSTRASTKVGNAGLPLGQTDLFFQTIAPQFYPAASNQY